MTATTFEEVRAEDLRAGDMLDLWCGRLRIVKIRPYTGPLDCIHAIAELDGTTSGISLEKGGYYQRVAVST